MYGILLCWTVKSSKASYRETASPSELALYEVNQQHTKMRIQTYSSSTRDHEYTYVFSNPYGNNNECQCHCRSDWLGVRGDWHIPVFNTYRYLGTGITYMQWWHHHSPGDGWGDGDFLQTTCICRFGQRINHTVWKNHIFASSTCENTGSKLRFLNRKSY